MRFGIMIYYHALVDNTRVLVCLGEALSVKIVWMHTATLHNAQAAHEVLADNQLWPMRAQLCQMSGVSHMKYVCDRPRYVKLTLRMIRSRSMSFSYSYEDLHNTHMIG